MMIVCYQSNLVELAAIECFKIIEMSISKMSLLPRKSLATEHYVC